MVMQQLDELTRALHAKATTYRRLQKEYAAAKRNMSRREAIKTAIRSAAKEADDAAESLRIRLEQSEGSAPSLLIARHLFVIFMAARQAFFTWASAPTDSNMRKLRESESSLSAALKSTSQEVYKNQRSLQVNMRMWIRMCWKRTAGSPL